MRGIIVRRAVLGDLKAIDHVYTNGCVDEYKTQNPRKSGKSILELMRREERERIREFARAINNPKFCWLVAESNGKIVGFSQARVERIRNKLKGFWDKAYIERKFRNKGIGKAFGRETIDWLKRKKAKTIEGGIHIKNKASIALCESFGLKPVAVRMFKEF